MTKKTIHGKSHRFAVCGFGSVSKKHIANIRSTFSDAQITVLTSQKLEEDFFDERVRFVKSFADLRMSKPDFCLIFSPAPDHKKHLLSLASLNKPLLIEKPLAANKVDGTEILDLVSQVNLNARVAYDIRFSKAFNVTRQALISGLIGAPLYVNCTVGQNLETWRPGRELSSTVSASKSLGGGVLRELSHELDYLKVLFGDVLSVNAMLGTQKFEKFDVEDVALVHMKFENNGRFVLCSLSMDFIRHDKRRSCEIIGESGTIHWDLVNGSVVVTKSDQSTEVLFSNNRDLAETKKAMIESFVTGDLEHFCSIKEAHCVLSLVEKIEENNAFRT